jgi:hypothetical protein
MVMIWRKWSTNILLVEGCKMVQTLWKSLAVIEKQRCHLTQKLHYQVCSQQKWNRYSRKILYMDVNTTICNSQMVETTQIFITWWMNKQNVYSYIHVKEYRSLIKWNDIPIYTMTRMNTENYAKWKKQPQNHVLFHLLEISRIGVCMKTECS